MPRRTWDLLRSAFRRAAPAAADPPTDGDLLDRFARDRDEAAFELLLWRHAGLVLGVCRRIVRDDHLAEDAFQATFLILARKAASVRRSASLAGWLHRVARRVAVRAARHHAARLRREGNRLGDEPAPAAESADDLRAVLDDEIDRLAERLRQPVVLCYLNGLSTEDAARLLGVPRGTVLSRLAAARQTLAGRLARRGVAPAVGLALLSELSAASAPAELIGCAVRLVAGANCIQPISLAEAVMRYETLRRGAAWVAAVICGAGLFTAVGILAARSAADPTQTARVRPDAPPDVEGQLREIDNRIHQVANRLTSRSGLEPIGEGIESAARVQAEDFVQARKLDEQRQKLEDDLRIRKHFLAAAPTPTQAEIEERAELTAPVFHAKRAVAEAKAAYEKALRAAGPDSPETRKAKETLDRATARLGEHRVANQDVARKILESDNARLVNKVRAEVASLETEIKVLATKAADLRAHGAERLAVAVHGEMRNGPLVDELRVLREVRQALIRRQIESKLGLNVPKK